MSNNPFRYLHHVAGDTRLYHGDCMDVLREIPDSSVDSVATDPPYDLTAGKKGGTGAASVNPNSPAGRSMIGTGNGGFMGKDWDATGIAFDPATWAECLLRWLVRLVTPPGGLVLDPFAGSGTTAEACVYEHMRCITIEREAEYLPLIVARLTR